MKREIINFDEFLAALDGLFTQTHICAFKDFKQRSAAAKTRRKENLPQLSEELLRLKTEIESYKRQIRQAGTDEGKKELGIQLNQLRRAKQEFVAAYRAEKNAVSFAGLSSEAKTYACAKSLVLKYIMPAVVKSSPQSYQINDDGTVSLNIAYFKNSDLYQQVAHICDYIASYIEHYPERVQGERYFVGLYKNVADFDGILAVANDYFEILNQQKAQDNLRRSHEGIEQIAVWPQYGVQAVRLKNKEALQYEGAAMHHCVSTYEAKVIAGTTEIYSIRDLGDENTELVPHATMEFKDGNIQQIKGPRDSVIDANYVEAARCLAMNLLRLESFDDLCRINLSDTEMRNLMLYRDVKGVFHDIYHMSDEEAEDCPSIDTMIKIKDTRLKALPLHKLKLKNLEISGVVSDKAIQHLSTAKKIDNIIFKGDVNIAELDLSAINFTQIYIESKNVSCVEKIILPPSANSLIIEMDMPQLSAIEASPLLKRFELRGKFNNLRCLPNSVSELILDGNFNSLAMLCENNYPFLEKLLLKGRVNYLPPVVNHARLKEFEICEAEVDNLEHVDLSLCGNLKRTVFLNSRFYRLKNIKMPPSAEYFSGSHCVYDVLESVDVSHMRYSDYGILQKINDLILFSDEEHQITLPKTGGCLTNFCDAPQLKEIDFPEQIHAINLIGNSMEQYDYASLSRYQDLNKLWIGFVTPGNYGEIDLSSCKKLEQLSIDNKLSQLKLPAGIKELHLGMKFEDDVVSLPDLTGYSALSKVSCEFVPDTNLLPSSLEILELLLIQRKSEQEVIDLSKFKNVFFTTSTATEFPNLRKILLAENFNDVIFFKTCPRLAEIDLSHTKGMVEVKEIDYNDELTAGEKNIYITSEQALVLEKIKLGAQTEIVLPECMASSPIVLEFPAQTPPEKLLLLQQKYPCARIIREPKSKTGFQPLGREQR